MSRSGGTKELLRCGPGSWPRAQFKSLPSRGQRTRLRQTGREQNEFCSEKVQVRHEVHLCIGGCDWARTGRWIPQEGNHHLLLLMLSPFLSVSNCGAYPYLVPWLRSFPLYLRLFHLGSGCWVSARKGKRLFELSYYHSIFFMLTLIAQVGGGNLL